MTPKISITKLKLLVESVYMKERGNKPLPKVWAWGCRSYYFRTLGDPNGPDRGINDDAIGIFSPNADFRVQANTDPSVYRKGVASLKANQVIDYKPGWHGYASIYGHQAFRQASPVVVFRDGTENYRPGVDHIRYGISLGNGYWTDKDWDEKFWTNLHRQSGSGTSSLGCLTIPREPWKVFQPLVMNELRREQQKTFPLILLDGPIN